MVLILFCLQHSESGTSFAVRIINMVCTMGLVAHWNGCLNFLIPMLNGFPSDCWIAINELQVLCCIDAMKLHRKQKHTCWQKTRTWSQSFDDQGNGFERNKQPKNFML